MSKFDKSQLQPPGIAAKIRSFFKQLFCSMNHAVIIAADKIADQQGCLANCRRREAQLLDLGITPRALVIDPLASDWHSPLAEDHFRSGCAPVEALARARSLILDGEPAVVISGIDALKTGYDRQERHQRMAIYGEDYPITRAYDELAQQFIRRQGIDHDQFEALARQLFDNYCQTYQGQPGSQPLPSDKWFNKVTPLFRGVDCANPLVDFEGRVLICSDEIARRLAVPAAEQVVVEGVGLGLLPGDGPDYLNDIAGYDHLKQACDDANAQAGINFSRQFLTGNALLEAYTCYPVVPMALLLAAGLVDELSQLPGFLARHPVTVTGGMNLSRAPWNNPALNGLISMYHQLRQGDAPLGAVHGNGGLGYRQGLALLSGHRYRQALQAA